jgi:hypothetical protein
MIWRVRFPPRSRAGVIGVYATAMALFTVVASTAYLVLHPTISWPRGAFFDISPIENYVVVTVHNDTGEQLRVKECYDALCHSVDFNDKVRPGNYVQDGINNYYSGYAFFRFEGRAVRGCIALKYRSGQRSAEIWASRAVPCSRIRGLPSPRSA